MTIYNTEYKPMICPFCHMKLKYMMSNVSYCGVCTNTYIGQFDKILKTLIRWLLK